MGLRLSRFKPKEFSPNDEVILSDNFVIKSLDVSDFI